MSSTSCAKNKTHPKLLTSENFFLKTVRHPRFFSVLCILTLVTGFVFRLYYTHITVYNITVHDTGGHLNYIKYIVTNKSIPNFDPTTKWCFYNPPFYYVCSAVVFRFLTGMGFPDAQAWELFQYFPCIVIFAAVIGMYKILKEFDIDGLPLWLATALLSFHPVLNYLSISITNDPLSLMLTVWAVYFAVRWYKEPTVKSIVGVALCVGLGMMTKLTVALIAPPIALLFVVKFFKDKQYISHLKQFGIFSVICFPLGLFWSVRNWWLFKTPVTYVQSLTEKSGQYIGGYSNAQRFGLPPFSDFTRVDSSWSRGTADHNLWSQTLRTSLFDDNMLKWADAFDENGVQTLDIGGTWSKITYTNLATTLMMVSLVMFVLLTGLTVVALFKAKQVNPLFRGFVAVAGVLLAGNFVKFCMDYPFTCTIHFRYIVPLLLYGCIGMGMYWSWCKKNWFNRILLGVVAAGIVMTVVISTVLYVNCLPIPLVA